VHKEVRDLSLSYHVLLAIGFGILTYTAWLEDSRIFLVKQISTTIPVVIIISQIFFHREDRWHEEVDPLCQSCNRELELSWNNCPFCGDEKSEEQKQVKRKHRLKFRRKNR